MPLEAGLVRNFNNPCSSRELPRQRGKKACSKRLLVLVNHHQFARNDPYRAVGVSGMVADFGRNQDELFDTKIMLNSFLNFCP